MGFEAVGFNPACDAESYDIALDRCKVTILT